MREKSEISHTENNLCTYWTLGALEHTSPLLRGGLGIDILERVQYGKEEDDKQLRRGEMTNTIQPSDEEQHQ